MPKIHRQGPGDRGEGRRGFGYEVVTGRVYVCDCPGRGKRSRGMVFHDRHFRSHTGEKPFKCEWPECGARFGCEGNPMMMRYYIKLLNMD